MKKILALVLILNNFIFADFEQGMLTMGGGAGFTKDLESKESELFVSPTFGYFLTKNLLVQIGYNYHQWEECEYNIYLNAEVCIDESESIFGAGAKVFIGKTYIGVEYLPGMSGWFQSPAGTNTQVMVMDFGEADMIAWKLGALAPIAENVYWDFGLHLMKYLDDDIDHDGMLYTTIGISYFWKNKK